MDALSAFVCDAQLKSQETKDALECTEVLSKLAHQLRLLPRKEYACNGNGVHPTLEDSLEFRKLSFLAEMGYHERATQRAVASVQCELDKKNGFLRHASSYASALEKLALTIATASMPKACSTKHNFPPVLPTRGTSENARTVRAEVACRIDLAGGWTDTPPITYQCKNPAVLNIAVRVDGKKPISCECSKLSAYSGVFIDVGDRLLHFREARDVWENRCHPNKDGSLICAILVGSGITDISRVDGVEYPKFCFECDDACKGLLIKCHSDLPHGSGMGTSSILSAALLAALWRLFNKEYTEDNVISTVLKVEQLHTTGGGWQDQVGGLMPGAKLVSLDPETNDVAWTAIPLSTSFKVEIDSRLVLVYTGTTRLAKNLLEQVILSWLRREHKIQDVVRQLSEDAQAAAEAMKSGTFPSEYCECYRSLKRTFSEDAEPPHVKELIGQLKKRGMIDAACMAGAGGGGFIYVWLADGRDIEEVRRFLAENKACHFMHASSIELDEDPLHMTAI